MPPSGTSHVQIRRGFGVEARYLPYLSPLLPRHCLVVANWIQHDNHDTTKMDPKSAVNCLEGAF